MKNIIFVAESKSYNPNDAFVAHLSLISSKDELLKQLSDKLFFPDYFGFNWDALFDCLRDFHWVNQYKIVLIHDDCIRLDKQDLRVYLQILIDATKYWEESKEHNLEVVFSSKEPDFNLINITEQPE